MKQPTFGAESRALVRRRDRLLRQASLVRAAGLAGMLLALASAVQAQQAPYVHPEYTVRQWTVRDGLPLDAIDGLLHTADSYLWLATLDGIARFDGVRFTRFNAANTTALRSNRFVGVHEGPWGDLWFSTEQGHIVRYRAGVFTRFDRGDGLPARVAPWNPFTNEGDTLWIRTAGGLVFYHDDRLTPYRPDVLDGWINDIQRGLDGSLWVATQQGLYRFRPAGTVQRYTTAEGLPLPNVSHVFEERSGVIWASTTAGVIRMRGDAVEPVPNGLRPWPGAPSSFYQDAEGMVHFSAGPAGWWQFRDGRLAPASGLEGEGPTDRPRPDPEGRLWRVVNPGATGHAARRSARLYRGDELILQAPRPIQDLAFDPSGDVWVATVGAGLYRLRPAVIRTYSTADGLPDDNVYPVLEARSGAIWLGIWGQGLVRLDLRPGARPTVTRYPTPAPNPLSLYEDRRGIVWAGVMGPLCQVRGGRCEPVDLGLPAAVTTGISAMHEDRQGRFWLGGRRGLVVGQPAGTGYTWTVLTTANGLTHDWIHVIVEARDGTLLFGTNGGGILRYNDTGTFEALTTAEGLASNNVRDLYEDAGGVLWIATEDRGLCRLDRRGRPALRGGALVCLNTAHGLYDDGLHRLLEDDQGRLWMNTNRGLFWVRRAELNAFAAGALGGVTSVSYTEEDGMRHREGNGGVQPAGIRARDGRLWFPTQGGMVVVDPSNVFPLAAPKAVIEAVQAGEAILRPDAPLVLGPGQRDVAFTYTAPAFAQPENVRFEVRLDGYDDAWHAPRLQRTAAYTNLPPGAYTFRVRAGLGGEWGTEAVLTLRRKAYAWETRWFYALATLLVLALGYGVNAYRLRRVERQRWALARLVDERTEQLRRQNARIEQQAEALRQLDAAKSRFFASLSHEFRTPLTLTFGPIDDLLAGRFAVAEAARPHLERARRNGHRLLRLINQLLDLSRLDAGVLHLEPGRYDLATFLRQITALFESLATARRLTLHVDLEAPFPHGFDADKMEKVVVNLLSNAVKFTPEGGTVSVTLRSEDGGTARLVVADTGRGIDPAHLPHVFDRFYQAHAETARPAEGSGIGLALAKELVLLHGGTISVESTVGDGTAFTVCLPDLDVPAPVEAALPESEWASSLSSDGEAAADGEHLAPDAAAPGGPAEEAPLVLVVEDNPDLRAYLRAHLDDGFEVVEATDGADGLAQARERVPDLVLTDLMMPVMDGLALCRALKADDRTSHIPVVLLTARVDVESRIEGFEEGAEAYLPKPFDAAVLRAQVRRLIAERRRLRVRPAAEPGAAPEAPPLPPREAAFLARLESAATAHLSDARFGVDALADEVGMSPRQLLRKLRALTGENPAGLLRRMRLAEAARRLQTGASVKETAYDVGFENRSSFTRAFREHYGVSPAGYAGTPRDDA